MSDAEYVDIICKFSTDKDNYEFTCTESFMKFEGFKIIYDEKIECIDDFIKMLKDNCYSYEYKSRTESDIISHTLSGCPSDTDSLVNI